MVGDRNKRRRATQRQPHVPGSQVGVDDDAGLRRSFAFLVSENYFALGGAKPAAGRFFDATETRAAAVGAAVIQQSRAARRMAERIEIQITGGPADQRHPVEFHAEHGREAFFAMLSRVMPRP